MPIKLMSQQILVPFRRPSSAALGSLRRALFCLAALALSCGCADAAPTPALTITSVNFTVASPVQGPTTSTVYVKQGGAITTNLSATPSGNANWGTVFWRTGTSTYACVDTGNTSSAQTRSFSISAPGADGTYSLDYIACSSSSCSGSCSGTASAVSHYSNLVVVDSSAPTISNLTIASSNTNPLIAKVGNVIALQFKTNDLNLSSTTPTVTIAGRTASVSGGVSGGVGTWNATITVGALDTAGPVAYNVTTTDLAGNQLSQGATSGVILSFTTATIACSDPLLCGPANPTAAAQVVWQVTFSESVTGVGVNNFSLTGSGTIVSVTGSGTTWLVTATKGVDGALGLNLSSNLSSIKDAGNASPQAVSAVPGNTYTMTPLVYCYEDSFDRGALGGDWITTDTGSTRYTPKIVSNRLQLTNNDNNESTAVHLQRMFPGAGNKIAVEFDHYSYGNTSGADGVGVILSDASLTPVAGAFGGSLGYAQKTGIPGFIGGWLGVGIDEYGNFTNPTEGRVDGPGSKPGSVAVRGSGSGQAGYLLHEWASASNIAQATLGPGYRYRITVDHTQGSQVWVTVDRDTTPTHTGYTNIIPRYDASIKSGQAAVPTNWFLSYTASTGGAKNYHEIDTLKVCAAKPILSMGLDHVRVLHDGSALTCAPETITLKACADPTCTALYLGSVTATLANPSGANWSSSSVTFDKGQTTVTLAKTAAGTVDLSGLVTAGTSTVKYYNGANIDTKLTYATNSCSFDAVEPGKAAGTPLYTKVAGVSFDLDLLALNKSSTAKVDAALVDQSVVDATGCGTTVLASASQVTFDGITGVKRVTFIYANAVRDARVRITPTSGPPACSSDNFAIRPASFSVASSNATNNGSATAPIFRAGSGAFQIGATALNSAGAVTSNYNGTALINGVAAQAHANAAATGKVSGTFAAAANGISAGSAFTYSEVGRVKLPAWGVYDNGDFAAVDKNKASSECFVDNYLGTGTPPGDPNTKNANGMYGCYFGSAAASPFFGRFVPDHFDTQITQVNNVPMTCPVGQICPPAFNGFVYSGQSFSVQVLPRNFAGNLTLNYNNIDDSSFLPAHVAYARAVQLSAWSAAGSTGVATGIAPAPAGIAAGAFLTDLAVSPPVVGATGVVSYSLPNPYSRLAPNARNWSAPVNVYLRATDDDGVTSLRAAPAVSLEDGVRVVSGRFALSNAYGSNLISLAIPVTAQYWNGTNWVVSRTDSLSGFTAANVVPSNCLRDLLSGGACIAGISFVVPNAAIANGVGAFLLNTARASGQVGLNLNAPAWLPSTAATAVMGVFKSPLIYIREMY